MPVRIAAASGFWGDWIDAPWHQVTAGDVSYLALDYLAELTMSILARVQERNPQLGYATDFVDCIRTIAPEISKRGIKVVTNAGGLNPASCATAVSEVLKELQLDSDLKIAVVTGDDLREALPKLVQLGEEFTHLDDQSKIDSLLHKLVSANAYLGSHVVADALKAGADIVITGRVIDAALAVGPLIAEFDIADDDYDALALATIGAHIIECGAQASGGNFSYDWRSVTNLEKVGFPILEASNKNQLTITKHESLGGLVSLESVKEQMVYEIGDPENYITADVIADFTSVSLRSDGENRVTLTNAKGKKPTEFYKVSASYQAGYKAAGTMLYSWPEAYDKATAAGEIIRRRLDALGLDEIYIEYIGATACHGDRTEVDVSKVPEVLLRVAVRGQEKAALERFAKEMAPLVLGGPPSATGYAEGRPRPLPVFAYFPTLIKKSLVKPEYKLV